MDHAALEHFIRETLGCGCPDEVFRQISREPPAPLHDGAILVGGRLLILLLDSEKSDPLSSRLDAVLQYGRRRRDREGFNRLRVVILGLEGEKPGSLLDHFSSSEWRDDRVHLHMVDRAAVPADSVNGL